MKKTKLHFKAIIMFTSIILLSVAITIFTVDPYLIYRFNEDKYLLFSDRNQNYSIAKHFDYDSIITGTSMSQNIIASSFDKLTHTRSIKTTFGGSSYYERAKFLRYAFSQNNDIKYVIFDVFSGYSNVDQNFSEYDTSQIELYDKIYFNDLKYLLNKSVIKDTLNVINFNNNPNEISTSLDDYSLWRSNGWGKEFIFKYLNRAKSTDIDKKFMQEDKVRILNNINQNIISITENNPKTKFVIYIPPFSVLYYDDLERRGTLNLEFSIIDTTIQSLISQDNIYLYSFLDEFDIVSNLDNYKDYTHYSPEINEYILNSIFTNKKERITADNYHGHINKITDFYSNYDYDTLYE